MENERNFHILAECNSCHQTTKISVSQESVDKYKNGSYIQDAFPYLSKDERELLISNTCGKCFDKMFKE